MTSRATFGAAPSRPVSTFVERLLDRLPRSGGRLIAVVVALKFIAAFVTALVATYWTHETQPSIVLWDGSLKVRKLLELVVFNPLAETILLALMVFLVSWFSPLSFKRASSGQVVIGVGLMFGALEAAIRYSAVFKGVVGGALTAYVYLRYRERSWLAATSMALVTYSLQNCVAAALLYAMQRWFPGFLAS